ncbi:MAG TPA: amino acid adenylation domain-containing protein [Blastocatellia bacterium]|nr:amino acid adenylation domain-containing protein [Blastocatellia bacterium]
MKPGGFVFAGDIRNLELLDVFQTSILLEKPLSELTIDDMRATIQSMTAQEEELLVSPKFFPALRLHIPQIGGVELHLKRGRHHNELTKYRYNAVLYIGAEHRTSGIEARFDWQRDSMNLDRLRELLSGGGHESLLVRDVPNCRIIGEIEAAASVRSGYAQPVSDLIERSRAAASEALDPETICRAGEALSYQACLYASGSFDNAFFDVLFTRTEADAGVGTRPMLFSNPVAVGADLAHRENALRSYVNHPLQDKVGASLVPELRRFLSERLPEYMIPSDLVVIDSLPRNANGKVDRKRLPRPSSRIRGQMSPGYAPPATPEEELIAGVWCQLLGVEHVGATDNFFDIGGHSLRATQAVSGIRDIFKVEIPLLQFFADPTVAGIARKVEVARRAGGGMSLPRVEPAVRGGLAPLSLAQQRLWFIDQLNPGTPVYNMPLGFRAKGQISYHVLAQAISEVVRRHETLRTVFVEREGPQQYVRLHSRICPSIADLSDVPDDAVLAAEARAIATQERDRPFNLGRGPVARFSILRFDSWEYALLITMHHIISDGWSFTIFMDEVLRLYEAFDGGLPSPLEEMEIQYADFCCWQREWIDKEIIDRQIAFWKERLGDAPPVVELPPDKPRPPVQSFFGASLPIAIPRNVISSVKEFARTNHATVFMVMLAAFQALLYRYTAEEMIITGTPIAGRNRAELERLIGFFVNTLIMKADVAGRHTFRELVDQVREFALGAYSNQEVPFEKLVEELHPKRDMSRNPLFQIMFALQSTPPGIENRLGFQLSAEESDASTARFDLELQLFENERAFAGHLTYSTDLYDEQAIRRLLSHYVTLLDRAAKEPGRRIEDLPLMTETDEAQAAGFWSGRRSPVPDLLIHQLFEAQARRTPDTVAAVGNGHFCSYRTLERSAERLARSLGRRGLEIESRAGVYVSRGIDMLVAVLGILKCGAAYVPLDPTYPAERMSCIIRDSRLGVLVTERQFQDQVSHHGVQGVLIEEVTGTVSRQARCGVADRDLARDEANVTTNEWYDEECVLGLSSANLAYVIYTSGSTGTPKGVAIEHGSAAALLQWAGGLFSKAELAWVLAATSICFDLSVFEIFAPLACGGTVVLAENALQIRELAARHSATLINTVPSAMVEIVSDGAIPDSVVTVNLAGEPVPGHLVREIFQKSGASRVYNLYGPTEDTTYSTFALLDSQCAERPGIGGPISNTQVYVLQPGCRPVPPGIRGVIHLSGSGLARCYLDKPDTTAETFLPAPFRGLNGVRMYSTGDLGCFLQDGKLDFLGRADHQVKIRGFRIELGEIEMVLRQHRAVRETTAIVVSSPNPNLVAYAVCEEGKSVTPAELKSFLAEKLPGYMTPSTAVILPRMPLTPNGKVDRRALADAADWWRDPFAYVAPTTRTEELIARIWEEMLGVKPIGLNHNFFDLGGHSLLAIRVLSRIREATGLSIPLAAIFQSPTVGQLAQILDGKAPLTDVSGLVEIQKGDERPALYLVPGIGGGLADFANLAPAIGPDQAVWVFTAFGANDIRPSVEETAEAYVEQLLELQPSGPYLIGGWSFGAVVAFEMAKRLRSRNKGVALLVLFDMVAPLQEGLRAMVAVSTKGSDDDASQVLFGGEASEPRVMAALVAEITRGAANVHLEEIETLSRQDMLKLLVDRVKSSNTIPPDIPSDVLSDWFCGYADRFRAMARYHPTVYPGRIVLFTARKLPADNPAFRARHASLGATLGWDQLVDGAAGGEVEVHSVNGSHFTMLEAPDVSALGTSVAEVIERALRLPWSRHVGQNTPHMG